MDNNMNPDNEIIPIVEDDMGEGYTEYLSKEELIEIYKNDEKEEKKRQLRQWRKEQFKR